MWLKKVELFNFKAYRQQIFNFPKPAQGRNLILIGGMNGYGKTTLLEASAIPAPTKISINIKQIRKS